MGNNHGKNLAGNSIESSSVDAITETGGATGSDNSQVVNKKGAVLIENKTDKTLKLREKIGVANGSVRYTIEAGKSLEIKVGPQSTYYRLLVYAVELTSSSIEDTNLTIDSDMLSDATHIVLCKKDSKYVLNFS